MSIGNNVVVAVGAVVYLRFSREDVDVAEGGKQISNSIANQKELVMQKIFSITQKSLK